MLFKVDTRQHNSWTMRLHEVSTPELAEVFAINAMVFTSLFHVQVPIFFSSGPSHSQCSAQVIDGSWCECDEVHCERQVYFSFLFAFVFLLIGSSSVRWKASFIDSRTKPILTQIWPRLRWIWWRALGLKGRSHLFLSDAFAVLKILSRVAFIWLRLIPGPRFFSVNFDFRWWFFEQLDQRWKTSWTSCAAFPGFDFFQRQKVSVTCSFQTHNFQTPIDEQDAASRVLDPVIAPMAAAQRGEPIEPPWGLFLKDYQVRLLVSFYDFTCFFSWLDLFLCCSEMWVVISFNTN